MRNEISLNSQTFLVLVLKYKKRRSSQIEPQLKVEIKLINARKQLYSWYISTICSSLKINIVYVCESASGKM